MKLKKIFLKEIALRNFKGVRELTIHFTDQETVISGDNGTGKTTVLDAFIWVLFGKDSTGRSDSGVSSFNIKTLGEDGKPILKLEHEVTCVLSVDGVEVTLQRTYLEKWDKPKGTAKETLKNHYTEYSINGVKVATKKEYDTEVSSIIPEDVFKMITSPFYFTALPAASQKAMLFDMVGNVSDQEIAALKPEYLELLSQLTGKSLEFFKKEIAAKKKALKDELDQIPARIDTANQLMPQNENWAVLETELATKKANIEVVENQIADKSKLVEADFQKKNGIQKNLGEKRLERTRLENSIRNKATEANNAARGIVKDLDYKIQCVSGDIERKRSLVSTVDAQIQEIETTLETLRGQYRVINNEQLSYPQGAFECPTCHRPLETDDIEAKQSELQANFNQNKSNRLQANKSDGIRKTEEKNGLQKRKEGLLAEISDMEKQITTLKGQKQYQEDNLPKAQDADAAIKADADWIRMGNEISDMENQLTIEAKPIDTSELREGKRILSESIDELKNRLAKRGAIERAQKLINNLEENKAANNQALADLERMEFIALDFQKAKDNELMNRINGMFSLVSFSFIDEQMNGGEKLTCVCTVNGTPYPDVNNAGKINAGLDIINAICRIKGVAAPIFIDNSESINDVLHTESQKILLRVSNHPKLMIKINSNDEPMELFQEL